MTMNTIYKEVLINHTIYLAGHLQIIKTNLMELTKILLFMDTTEETGKHRGRRAGHDAQQAHEPDAAQYRGQHLTGRKNHGGH